MTRYRASAVVVPMLLALGGAAASADAAVPFADMTSSGPLTSVALGNELSCQVVYAGDSRFEIFPNETKPGDCGTFLTVGDALFAPSFADHGMTGTVPLGAYSRFTPISQSGVSGQGTVASPLKVTTVAVAGRTGVRITQVDSYVAGEESYRSDVTLLNGGGSAVSGVLYRAGDCYLQGSDTGYGFVDEPARAVGCATNANNVPAARIEQWYPLTGGSQFMEGRYAEIWTHIVSRQPFPNTMRAAEAVDNGAGISWTYSLGRDAQETFSHYTVFSPRGVAGPPPAALPRVPSAAFGAKGLLETPSNARCVSRRYFRIRLRKTYWPVIGRVTVLLRGRTRVLTRPPWGTIADLRGLKKRRFTVRITARTTTGRTIKGTRNYRTCGGKLRGTKPKL